MQFIFRFRGSFSGPQIWHCEVCGMRPPWSTRTPKHIPNNAPPTDASTIDGIASGGLPQVAVFFDRSAFATATRITP